MTCTSFCSLILSSFNCLDLPIFIHDSVVIVVEVFVIGMLLFAHSHISRMTFALLLVFFLLYFGCMRFVSSQPTHDFNGIDLENWPVHYGIQ